MKLVLMAASAATALSFLAAPASFAATSSIAVGGSVAAACGVGSQSGGGTTPAGSDTVALGSLTDANGFVSVADRTIDFGNIWCNKSASVTMNVSKLTTTANPTTDTGSFTQSLDMEVTDGVDARGIFVYLGAASSVSSATNGGVLNATMPQAFETGTNRFSKALLKVVAPANDRPVAGDYSGTVSVTVATN